jgi:hypothetical protein
MESFFGVEGFQRMREWTSSVLHRWRITYHDLSGADPKFYEIDAVTDHEAVEAFMSYVQENNIALRLPKIGERDGDTVVGLEISVLSNGVWVDPSSIGL